MIQCGVQLQLLVGYELFASPILYMQISPPRASAPNPNPLSVSDSQSITTYRGRLEIWRGFVFMQVLCMNTPRLLTGIREMFSKHLSNLARKTIRCVISDANIPNIGKSPEYLPCF